MSMTTIEHPAIATKLENGVQVARDNSIHGSVDTITIWAQATNGVDLEGLLAIRTGDSRARLLAVPAFTAGLRLDDIVDLWMDEETGAEVITGIAVRSKYAVVVVRLDEDPVEALPVLRRLMEELQGLDCWFDPINHELVGLALPAVLISSVSKVLESLVAEQLVTHWMRLDQPTDGTIGIYT